MPATHTELRMSDMQESSDVKEDKVHVLAHILESVKSMASRQATALTDCKAWYAASSMNLLEVDPGDGKGIDWEARVFQCENKVQQAEGQVVQARIMLQQELVSSGKPSVPTHVPPQELVLSPTISVQYTYSLQGENGSYQPQRERVWRIPLMWSVLEGIFEHETKPESVSEILKVAIPQLTWVATGDKSTQKVREWVKDNFKSVESFSLHTTADDAGIHEDHTHYPAYRPPHPKPKPTRIFSAKAGEGGRSRVDVIISTLPMDPPKAWHNPLINEYVHTVVEHVGMRMNDPSSPPPPCTTTTVMITDDVQKVVHYMRLYPFHTPDICQTTHIIISGVDRGILERSRTVPISHNMQNAVVLTNHHYRTESRRYNELDLNSMHAQALLYHDRQSIPKLSPHAIHYTTAKSARLSSANHDILVSSVDEGNNHTRTAISIVTYPLPGLFYDKRTRRNPGHRRPNGPGPHRNPNGSKGGKRTRNGKNGEGVNGRSNTKVKNKKLLMDHPSMPAAGHFATLQWHTETGESTHTIFLVDFDSAREFTEAFVNTNLTFNTNILEDFKDVYKKDLGMTKNVKAVKETAHVHGKTMTMLQYYRESWFLWIRNAIGKLYDELAAENNEDPWKREGSPPYLYTSSSEIWSDFIRMEQDIFNGKSTNMFQAYPQYMQERVEADEGENHEGRKWEEWKAYSLATDEAFEEQGHESVIFLGDPCPSVVVQPTGPRPVSYEAPSALLSLVQQLQERIECMQADQERAEGNTEHILREVLTSVSALKRGHPAVQGQ